MQVPGSLPIHCIIAFIVQQYVQTKQHLKKKSSSACMSTDAEPRRFSDMGPCFLCEQLSRPTRNMCQLLFGENITPTYARQIDAAELIRAAGNITVKRNIVQSHACIYIARVDMCVRQVSSVDGVKAGVGGL